MSDKQGSVILGIELETNTVEQDATKIGIKIGSTIAKEVEKALKNTDPFGAFKAPEFKTGSGVKSGNQYGKEFMQSFERILATGDIATAKLFKGGFDRVASTEGAKAANYFVKSFDEILARDGSKNAAKYSRGLGAALSVGGSEAGIRFMLNFDNGLKSGAAKSSQEFVKVFNSTLVSANPSAASLLDKIYSKVSAQSLKAANEFVSNFERVLKQNSPKEANEFAKGFGLAFAKQGDEGARRYLDAFNLRLAQNQPKTTLKASGTDVNQVLAKSDPGTARVFANVFNEAAKTSNEAANIFSTNFRNILTKNTTKDAKEFANGYLVSLRSGGVESANAYLFSFNQKLAANQSQIPQNFANAFSRILAKSGSTTAKQFASTYNQILGIAGKEAADNFEKKFSSVLKKGGDSRAKEYAKGIALAYVSAGQDSANNFSKQFKNSAGINFKSIGSFMRDTLVSAIGNGLAGAVLGIFNGIFSTIKGAIGGIFGQIQDSIGKFMSFNKGITQFSAITGANPEQTNKVESAIRNTSLNTTTKAPELTNVATELSKAGTPLDQINEKLLKSISLMSRLSGEDANATAGMVSQIQSSFGLPLEDMVSTMDLMTAVANGSQASIGSLAQGMTYAGATAKSLGVSVQETAKYLGILSNNGLDASRGGTALQNTFADMAKNAQLLEQLGVRVFDEKGVQRFGQAFLELKGIIKDLNNEDQYKVLSQIFGERGLRGVQALMTGLDPLDKKTQELVKNMNEMGGSLERAGEKLNDPASKFDILGNKVDELKVRLGEAFEPGINALADFGNQTADYLLNNTDLFDLLNQANQEFADYLEQHPEYAQMLSELMEEIAVQIMQELLNGTKQLLQYLKENPNAVKDLISGFKDFVGMVMNVLPMVGKLVELLYNGAQFLGLIKDGANNSPGQSDPSGKEYFASGLYTAPEAYNGGSSEYHIDTKFAKDLPFDRVIAAMDSMAFAYEEQGRVIEFSNAAVGGQRYDPNDSNRGELIKKAFGAHSHSVHSNWNSLDYYVPKKDKNRFHENPDGTPSLDSGAGVEMMLPAFKGGKTEYGTSSDYGNYAVIVDESGKDIIKTGHGDSRKPIPKTRISDQGSSSEADNFGLMTGKKSYSSKPKGKLNAHGEDEDYAAPRPIGRTNFSSSENKGVVLAERTGVKDDKGLEQILVRILDRQGNSVFEKYANSGDPNKQNKFAGSGKSKAEVREPLEYGRYSIGQTINSGLPGVGSKFTPIQPKFDTNRTDLGIHYDADRKFNPGSAGCLVFKTEAEFNDFQKYLRSTGITDFEFRDGSQETSKMRSSGSSGKSSSAPKVSIPGGLTSKGNDLAKYLSNPRIRAFFDAVSVAEGTNTGSKGGYDVSFGGKHTTRLDQNHFNYGKELTPSGRSSASGRYQAMGHSWAEESEKLGLKKMDPASQDLFALGRLDMRGILGNIAKKDPSQWDDETWKQISMEWASVSSPSGDNYHGQKTNEGSKFTENYRKSLKGLSGQANPINDFKTASSFNMPQYKSLEEIMGGSSGAVNEFIELGDSKGSKLDKMRAERQKAVDKMLKEQQAIEKKEQSELKKNAKESLTIKREIKKQKDEVEEREFKSKLDSQEIQFANTPFREAFGATREKAETNFKFKKELEDENLILDDIRSKYAEIKETRGDEKGIDGVLQTLKEQEKATQDRIKSIIKLQGEELKLVGVESEGKFALERRQQQEKELTKILERKLALQKAQQDYQLDKVKDPAIKEVLSNSFKLGDLSIEKEIKTKPISDEIKLLKEQLDLASKSGFDFGDSLGIMQDKLQSLEADLKGVNEEFDLSITKITEQNRLLLQNKRKEQKDAIDSSVTEKNNLSGNQTLNNFIAQRKALESEENRFREQVESINALRGKPGVNDEELDGMLLNNRKINEQNTENIYRQPGGYQNKLFDSRVSNLKDRGFGFEAAEMEQTKARIDEFRRFGEEMKQLEGMKGFLPVEEFNQMVSAAKEINLINLDNISRQFETLGNVIKNTAKAELQTFAKNAITDFGNIGEHFNTLIDNMLSKMLDMFLNQMFSSLFGGGGGLLGGLFGGGGLDVALDTPLLGFSKGGIVPGGGQGHIDSVLTMLAPGEGIIPSDQMRELQNYSPPSVVAGKVQSGGMMVQNNSPVSITVNIDGNGDSSIDRQGANSLGSSLEGAILAVIQNQQNNPGGAFYNK